MAGLTFQEIILRLNNYWAKQGCILWNAHHEAVGAGTFNPATLLRVLGPEPWNVAYVEPSFRPDDGRFAENPNRLLMHHQYQVIMQPPPLNPPELYLRSLFELGIKLEEHDIRFVEDNWESPAISAWGLGWEVWLDGMEITQFTYFQQAGGITLDPPACEITYGLERLAMFIQDVDSVWDLRWNEKVLYSDILKRQEIEFCEYAFNSASIERSLAMFEIFEKEAGLCIENKLPTPALDFVSRCSHVFNVLDTRGAIGLSERVKYFGRMRDLTRQLAELFVKTREDAGLPLLSANPPKVQFSVPAIPVCTAKQDDFVLEIGCEELAASVPQQLVGQIEELLPKMLKEAGLSYDSIYVTATPRRVAAIVGSLQGRQLDVTKTVRGPTKDAAAKNPAALQGFCKKNSITPEQIGYETENGVEYVVAKVFVAGQSAPEVLAKLVPNLVMGLKSDDTMRWLGSAQYDEVARASFNRPVRWIVALYGDLVVPFSCLGIMSGRETKGGRWNGSPTIVINSANTYKPQLLSAGIVLDSKERLTELRRQVEAEAAKVGGVARIRDALLEEVSQLVEMPTACACSFEERFTSLPTEVVVGTMEKHVRCFSVFSKDGKLLPYFIAVRNGNSSHIDIVRRGYERLIRARFSDAAFFIKCDSEKKLEDFREDIRKLVFHQKVGSMFDKCERLVSLSEKIVGDALAVKVDAGQMKRAAQLAKADLGTQMVTEMTSLQGEMGRFYALKSGEPETVATALLEQYFPRSAGGALPKTPLGIALSVVDRVDTVSALFSVGVEPTGSADPFGVRREVVGLLSVVLDTNTDLQLERAIEQAMVVLKKADAKPIVAKVVEFISKRLEVILRERGYRHDVVRAVLLKTKDPLKALNFVKELQALAYPESGAASVEFVKAAQAVLRCKRIVDFAKKKKVVIPSVVDQKLLVDSEEKNLVAAVSQFSLARADTLQTRFKELSRLAPSVDAFFEKVMVMAEDQSLQNNRLAIAESVVGLVDFIALGELELAESAEG